MKIKICGITKEEDVLYCDSIGADFLGFIFVRGSPRRADLSLSRLRTKAEKVAVLRNPEKKEIETLLPYFEFFQLHGLENEAVIKFLRERKKKVIKTIFPDISESVEHCRRISHLVDFFLVDSSSKFRGSYSSHFSRDSLKKIVSGSRIFGKDFFLGGGLNPWNVSEVISEFSPYGVDVASGVEFRPGEKSFCKVKLFYDIVKGYLPDMRLFWRTVERGILFTFPSGEKVLFSFGISDVEEFGYMERKVLIPNQKHTSEVLIYPDEYYEGKGEFDGFVVRREDMNFSNNITFGVKTADCLPVFFVSDAVLGVFHAGWRGLVGGILDRVVEKMEKLGGEPKRTFFVIGPYICGRCYEVGEDVRQSFISSAEKIQLPHDEFITELGGGKYFIDIGVFASLYLERFGACVFRSDICVREDSRFLSRRRGDSLSQISLFADF